MQATLNPPNNTTLALNPLITRFRRLVLELHAFSDYVPLWRPYLKTNLDLNLTSKRSTSDSIHVLRLLERGLKH